MKNFLKNIFRSKSENIIECKEEEVKETLPPFITYWMLMQMEETLLREINNQCAIAPVKISVPEDIKQEKSRLVAELYRLKSLGLQESKNYKILDKRFTELKDRIDEVEDKNFQNKKNYTKAKLLIRYISLIKEYFGKDATLVDREKFKNLLKRYQLETGFLEDYTGIIPEENLDDISHFQENYNCLRRLESPILYYTFTSGEYKRMTIEDRKFLLKTIGVKDYNSYCRFLTNDSYFSLSRISKITTVSDIWIGDYVKSECKKIKEEYKNSVLLLPSSLPFYSISQSNSHLSFYNPSLEKYRYLDHIDIKTSSLNSPLMIACPKEDLQTKNKIKIEQKPKDPIVYFDSPFGVVVITAWGKESEDEIIKHYTIINNILKDALV